MIPNCLTNTTLVHILCCLRITRSNSNDGHPPSPSPPQANRIPTLSVRIFSLLPSFRLARLPPLPPRETTPGTRTLARMRPHANTIIRKRAHAHAMVHAHTPYTRTHSQRTHTHTNTHTRTHTPYLRQPLEDSDRAQVKVGDHVLAFQVACVCVCVCVRACVRARARVCVCV